MYLVYCLFFIFNGCVIQEPFHIWFERTGGFAGMITMVEIDSKTLSVEEQEKVEEFIEKSGFFEFVSDSLKTNHPDQFQYKITIEYKNDKKSLEFGESGMPNSLRPLVDYLNQKARKRK